MNTGRSTYKCTGKSRGWIFLKVDLVPIFSIGPEFP